MYGYQAYRHYHDGQQPVHPRSPDPELSTAENILRMLRPDCSYTELEARVLDIALILHAEHGGGNNSTFTTHVVTSSGTDTYSAMAAALGSLKGPKHGGANIKVVQMFEDIKEHVKDWNDDEELAAYLRKLLHKEAFDKAGLIYGMGHAVYSLSDPRAKIHGPVCGEAVQGEGPHRGVRALRHAWSGWPPEVIAEERKIYKGVSANVDFYSGFVYQHAGSAHGAVHPHFRHGPHCRLERPPHGGAHRRGQDHPPGLHGGAAPPGLPPGLNKKHTAFYKKGRAAAALRRPFLRPCVKNRQGLLQKFSHPLDYGVTL